MLTYRNFWTSWLTCWHSNGEVTYVNLQQLTEPWTHIAQHSLTITSAWLALSCYALIIPWGCSFTCLLLLEDWFSISGSAGLWIWHGCLACIRVGCWCGSKVYVHMGPSDAAQWLLMGKLFRFHSNILAKNCSSFKYELAQCGFHTFLSAYHRVLYLSTCLSVSPTKTLSNSKIFLVSTFVVYMSHVFS